jgi:hypothetical protein
MKKMLMRVLIFVAVFAAFLLPSRWVVEKLWTKNVPSGTPAYFPVLVQSAQNKFAVNPIQSLSPGAKVVTEIREQDLDEINRDLRSSISADNSKYEYFRIIGRGDGYTDVSLEAPAKGDFWPKAWYRVQNGAVHPQRILFYGPSLGIAGLILPLGAGIIAVLIGNRFINHGPARPLTPAVLPS